ncbi:MAG TPA: hypothetical protein VFX59_26290 [Polyangiales bacterium]|nr:hypothetical protein [Polyangiales bacterium]
MPSALDTVLDLVKRKVAERAGGNRGSAGGILGQITDLLAQKRTPARGKHDVRPASEDPYGDPADEKGARKVKPASEDPYGDPADEER